MLRELKRKYRDEAIALINSSLARAAQKYESMFSEKIKFSFDESALDESLEYYQVSQYTAQSRAFYRVSVLAKIE
jgi:hypothetical protein